MTAPSLLPYYHVGIVVPDIAAAKVELSAEDLREIDDASAAIEVQGARYPDFMQKLIGR